MLSAVGPNNRLYTSDELLAILRGQLASESSGRSYRTLYVTDAKVGFYAGLHLLCTEVALVWDDNVTFLFYLWFRH